MSCCSLGHLKAPGVSQASILPGFLAEIAVEDAVAPGRPTPEDLIAKLRDPVVSYLIPATPDDPRPGRSMDFVLAPLHAIRPRDPDSPRSAARSGKYRRGCDLSAHLQAIAAVERIPREANDVTCRHVVGIAQFLVLRPAPELRVSGVAGFSNIARTGLPCQPSASRTSST